MHSASQMQESHREHLQDVEQVLQPRRQGSPTAVAVVVDGPDHEEAAVRAGRGHVRQQHALQDLRGQEVELRHHQHDPEGRAPLERGLQRREPGAGRGVEVMERRAPVGSVTPRGAVRQDVLVLRGEGRERWDGGGVASIRNDGPPPSSPNRDLWGPASVDE